MTTPADDQSAIESIVQEVVVGRSEYHVRWGVRRYDLTNVRDDLDLCSDVGRAFVIWGSVFIGIGFTLAVTFFSTLAASKHPAWLLELAGYGAILFIALGIGSFWADHKFQQEGDHND